MYRFRYKKIDNNNVDKLINKINKFEMINLIINQFKYKILIKIFNILNNKFFNQFKLIISIQFK